MNVQVRFWEMQRFFIVKEGNGKVQQYNFQSTILI